MATSEEFAASGLGTKEQCVGAWGRFRMFGASVADKYLTSTVGMRSTEKKSTISTSLETKERFGTRLFVLGMAQLGLLTKECSFYVSKQVWRRQR